MYIRRFKYKPDDVDCRLCTEFRKRRCTQEGCPWITERIEAGVVSYAEAVQKILSKHPLISGRLVSLVDSYSGTFWIDDRHQNRMDGSIISWATIPGAIPHPTTQHCIC